MSASEIIDDKDHQPKEYLGIHNLFNKNEIDELHKLFESAKNKRFSADEFKIVLAKFDVTFTEEEFHVLFLKINTKRNNYIDWDEFISYFILGFQDDDPYENEALVLPISSPPKMRLKAHSYPICRVTFCPNVLPDRTIDYMRGSYVTVSNDGRVNYWSLDLEIQRTGKSKNPYLKVAKTLILDAVCLPDVRILCTSSSERDLRFYDTTANNFDLRVIITSLPWPVSSLFYYFNQSLDICCKLLMGDYGGNVRILSFNALLRGPFQSKPGTALIKLSYNELVQGKLPLIHVTEYLQLHNDIIRQVQYVECINSFISAAQWPPTQKPSKSSAGIMICEMGVKKKQTAINANKGMTCFAFDEESFILATGGQDTVLRLWNPIVPKKAIAILPGHSAGITFIFIQENGKRIYSIDRKKVIKVWDAREQNIIQTYTLLISAFSDQCPCAGFYNDVTRDLVVAGMQIAAIKCSPLLRLKSTDGTTHSRPVSVVLYNELFKVIVTCGYDSFIIVWDPWTGKRLTLIRMAHSRIINGEILRVQITAACFDPKEQLLLTGARNGTLKVWNFNNGVCIRNLSIEPMCEVTSVIWVKNRMLAVGWNRHVTEFADSGDTEYGKGKEWDIFHMEDVLSAAARIPQTLATGSYSGELILWKLETGQPYRRYYVGKPHERIKIHAPEKRVEIKLPERISNQKCYDPQVHKITEHQSNISDTINTIESESTTLSPESTRTADVKTRKLSIIKIPSKVELLRSLAVQTVLFLETRPMKINYGTLFVALDNGVVQVYSHHQLGGYLDYFNAVHMAGDVVVSMTTDKENKYLFTATALGYIKIWLIVNFCVPYSSEDTIEINEPLLRLKFPFLLKDRFEARAKRSAKSKNIPKLLNSFKGHLRSINQIVFIDETELIISASGDCSVRLWTLGGRYIGTLGSPISWIKLSSTEPPNTEFPHRLPPDIERVASFTTLKVLKGGEIEQKKIKVDDKQKDEIPLAEDAKKQIQVYGKPLTEPILGKHFQLPPRGKTHLKPVLDKSLPYIPIYAHLDVHHANVIEKPSKNLIKNRDQNLVDSERNE